MNFWKTTYISDKSKRGSNIILMEGDSIVNDPMNVADILNDYFFNIADARMYAMMKARHVDDRLVSGDTWNM